MPGFWQIHIFIKNPAAHGKAAFHARRVWPVPSLFARTAYAAHAFAVAVAIFGDKVFDEHTLRKALAALDLIWRLAEVEQPYTYVAVVIRVGVLVAFYPALRIGQHHGLLAHGRAHVD